METFLRDGWDGDIFFEWVTKSGIVWKVYNEFLNMVLLNWDKIEGILQKKDRTYPKGIVECNRIDIPNNLIKFITKNTICILLERVADN